MYAALWRALRGGRLAKAAQCVVLAALVVVALFGWVFPWVAQMTGTEDSATLDASRGAVRETPGTGASPCAIMGA